MKSPSRYSEDIDLVQMDAGAIGSPLDEMRRVLDSWLGEPGRRRGPGSVSLVYRFQTSTLPVQTMRLKVEINTREWNATWRGSLVFIPTEPGHLFRREAKKWPPSGRNGWPLCLGMGGRLRLEWVAGLARNMHQWLAV